MTLGEEAKVVDTDEEIDSFSSALRLTEQSSNTTEDAEGRNKVF